MEKISIAGTEYYPFGRREVSKIKSPKVPKSRFHSGLERLGLGELNDGRIKDWSLLL
jgi:hypothetical protein